MLVDKVYISEISVNALQFTDENVEEFCQIFSSMKNCQISFPPVKREEDNDYHEGSSDSDDGYTIPWGEIRAYKFSIVDIETFARHGTKVSFMSSSVLRYQLDLSNLLKFLPALTQLRYLRCFEFQENSLRLDHNNLRQFAGLPIQSITTKVLAMNKENVSNFVDILSKVKSLEYLHIVSNGFKLSPEHFKLFDDLPVKKVNLTALDLNRQNVPKFREIMNEMKIEKIISSLTKKKRGSLGIRFHQFGSGEIYWSI